MCRKVFHVLFLLLFGAGAGRTVAALSSAPTTTLAAQTTNNTSAVNSFIAQSNGNSAPKNISKVNVHSLLYPGADTKIYAHLLLWFGGSNHMNVGYNSTDPAQIHRQIADMISRGIDGVIIDWYGPNNSIDQSTKLVMAEAETHPGFTFAIMVDQGAIEWNPCSGCSPQAALISQLQYIEQTYFPSPAYMTMQGRPIVTNFNIDLSYSIDWDQVNAALSAKPAFLFQNNNGFTHALSEGSYSWVMPTTTDYGVGYLANFYGTGMSYASEQTVGASYKGFNDTLASWGSNRIMGQQCGQTWLQTFSEANRLYNSGRQLAALQLVTWNDYEEATEIETGINNCVTVSAAAKGNSLNWSITGNENTIDHYVAYLSTDGQNLMSLAEVPVSTSSVNLCSYTVPNGKYISYIQAVGKPSITNQMSSPVQLNLNCGGTTPTTGSLKLQANPSSMSVNVGGTGALTVTVSTQSGSFSNPVALTCSGLPSNLSCSFSPSSVTPGSGAVSSILTVKATAVNAANRSERRSLFFATGLFSFSFFGIALVGNFERRRLMPVIAVLGLVTVLSFGTSCGGNSFNAVNASSRASTYVVSINGSANSAQVSTTVTVTVK